MAQTAIIVHNWRRSVKCISQCFDTVQRFLIETDCQGNGSAFLVYHQSFLEAAKEIWNHFWCKFRLRATISSAFVKNKNYSYLFQMSLKRKFSRDNNFCCKQKIIILCKKIKHKSFLKKIIKNKLNVHFLGLFIITKLKKKYRSRIMNFIQGNQTKDWLRLKKNIFI